MKFFVSSIIIIVLIFTCSEDSGDNNGLGPSNGNTAEGKMTMTINGNSWESVSAGAVYVVSDNTIISIGVGGSNSQNENLSIGVAELEGVKEKKYTYMPGSVEVITATYINLNDTTQTSTLDATKSLGGEVTITDLKDNYVSGTFSFDLYNETFGTKIEIRNGVFNKVPIFIKFKF